MMETYSTEIPQYDLYFAFGLKILNYNIMGVYQCNTTGAISVSVSYPRTL